MEKLPTSAFFKHLPAIPVDVNDALSTLRKLKKRENATEQAKQGLTTSYRIDGKTATGYDFLYGATPVAEDASAREELVQSLDHRNNRLLLESMDEHLFGDKERSPSFLRFVRGLGQSVANLLAQLGDDEEGDAQVPTGQSLETPEQYSMSWTVMPDVYDSSSGLLGEFAATLADADIATERFWPTISDYGLPYNLLIARKLTASKTEPFQAELGDAWKPEWDALAESGRLYAIDLRIFDGFKPRQVDGRTRFTPGTVTLLERDPKTKDLTPIAVRVAGYESKGKRIYVRGEATPSAWLYALQAAKVSITVYGIWLGHVYPWHVVTGAMQYTMYKCLSQSHPIYKLLRPQSKYLIGFDTVLLILWKSVAPPTAIETPRRFLKLCDHYADGRSYFDDDPPVVLKRLGIREADFTDKEPWDKYAFLPHLLRIWDIVDTYTKTFVDATYRSDRAVKNDGQLQDWIKRSRSKRGGNIRGLPRMDSREDLHRVLRSYLYRVTVHGCSRLGKAANPGLTFVGNYPPCLQDASIPAPNAAMTTKKLLRLMPATDTIAGMVKFYFTFAFSVPYESFIPFAGFDQHLIFDGGMDDERNRALVQLRQALAKFIADYSPASPQLFQWPANVET